MPTRTPAFITAHRGGALIFLAAAIGISARAASTAPPATGDDAPRAELVMPGVWRLRFGTPEKITPLTYASGQPQREALAALPAADQPPIPPGQITFSSSSRGCSIVLPRAAKDHFYGLGLNTKLFEMTNQRAFIIPSDHPEQSTNESHAPVPFYVSSRGFGVYVDTARFASFYMGNVDPVAAPAADTAASEPALSVEALYKDRHQAKGAVMVDIPTAQGVDVYLFAGPTMLDAVRRYNLYSGGGCVPPLWGLGIAYRGQGQLSADDSIHLAQTFRDQHIPCDQWGLEPGWQSTTYSSSFMWNTTRFPDPDAFFQKMHAMGYRVNVWQHAFVNPVSPLYTPLLPWSGNYRVWNGLVPDFATPEGRKIFVDHQEQVLFSKGADGLKLDECDFQPFRSSGVWSFPEASRFPSGMDGEQMHSLFGIIYQQAMQEPFIRRNLRTWGLVRDSHALAASLPYTVYSDSYDHRCYIRGLAKSGFSGLLWVPEVRNADSLDDLYRRVETVIFSPYALINCWYMRMPPWIQIDRKQNNAGVAMPQQQEATATIRKLFDLRMSLVPYLYTAFNTYHCDGTPPVRAMVMEWPDDPQTALIDDQFMLGSSLLVAPLIKGQSHRSVYLPAGVWYDFRTHEQLDGGRRIDVAAASDQIPVFVRGDTLLPLAVPVEHVADDTRFDIHVLAFGDHPAPFTLFDDDGTTLDYSHGAQNQITLTWDGHQGAAATHGEYHGPSRYRILDWSVPTPGASQ